MQFLSNLERTSKIKNVQQGRIRCLCEEMNAFLISKFQSSRVEAFKDEGLAFVHLFKEKVEVFRFKNTKNDSKCDEK